MFVLDIPWSFLFGITMYLEYELPLEYAGISVTTFLCIRALMNFVFYKMLVKDDRNQQQRSIPEVAMIWSMEMVRANPYFYLDLQ